MPAKVAGSEVLMGAEIAYVECSRAATGPYKDLCSLGT